MLWTKHFLCCDSRKCRESIASPLRNLPHFFTQSITFSVPLLYSSGQSAADGVAHLQPHRSNGLKLSLPCNLIYSDLVSHVRGSPRLRRSPNWPRHLERTILPFIPLLFCECFDSRSLRHAGSVIYGLAADARRTLKLISLT